MTIDARGPASVRTRERIHPDEIAGHAMLTPAIVLLGAIAVYPIAAAVWLSLHRAIVVFHERRFIGLGNYLFLLRDPRFGGALAHTLYFAVVSVIVEFVLGLAVALLLDRAFRGRGALRALVLLPWAVPTVISARAWALLFEPERGLIARALPFHDIDFLGLPGYAIHAAILVDVWKSTPFVALLLLAGLQDIPSQVLQAARVDGASPWQAFWSVTLPLLRPAIVVTILFRTLDAIRVFDAIYVLTAGGPANTTETLSIYAYKTLMRGGDFGYGSALAVATFGCVALVSFVWLRLFGRDLRGGA